EASGIRASTDCGGSRFAKNGDEALGQGEAAEEQSGVEGVARERVPEERKAAKIASGQTRGGFGEGIQEPPYAEVGDEKKLNRAEESRGGDASERAMIVHPASDEHAEKKAGVDDGHEFVEADEDVANEEGQRRKGKREATVAEEGSGKESHRADRCEIPRMWCDAESGGDDNYGEGEQQAIKQRFFWRDFGVHISTPCAPVKPAGCSECKSDTKVV